MVEAYKSSVVTVIDTTVWPSSSKYSTIGSMTLSLRDSKSLFVQNSLPWMYIWGRTNPSGKGLIGHTSHTSQTSQTGHSSGSSHGSF